MRERRTCWMNDEGVRTTNFEIPPMVIIGLKWESQLPNTMHPVLGSPKWVNIS
jgi:hypothetical protein